MDTDSKNQSILLQAEKDPNVELDNPSGVIFEIQRDGKIVYVSSALYQITGYQSYEVLGKGLDEFLEALLGRISAKQLIPIVLEVLEGSRSHLESKVQAIHPETSEKKLYYLQIESSSENFNRSLVLLRDLSLQEDFQERLDQSKVRSMRLLEYGNLIIVRCDTHLQISEILGDTQAILGISSKELELHPDYWLHLVENQDLLMLSKTFYRLNKKPKRFEREIRVRNQATKEMQWIFFSAIPIFQKNQLVGWEGFAFDVTEKKNTELKLIQQRQRYNALYNVAINLEVQSSPEVIALKSLNSLIDATKSSSGLVVFYNQANDSVEMAAAKGYSQGDIDFFNQYLGKQKNIFKGVIKAKKSIIVNNVAEKKNYKHLSNRVEKIVSFLAVPLLLESPEEKILGVLMLSDSTSNPYLQADLDLVNAASGHIALVIQQSNYLNAEKTEADLLNVLYRHSHNMTKVASPEEVAEFSFPVINETLGSKRIWMGVLNESATHIQGIAGIGPGVRKQISRVQIELALVHDYIDQVVKTKKPVVFKTDQQLKCSGLNRMIDTFKPEVLAIIPMLSVGQLVGIIILEPQSSNLKQVESKFRLLTSIATEMGTAIMSRNFESKIAKTEKMRMAGMLASGVAHNFNNLLQAIIGQASLVESQLAKDSKLKDSIKIIFDSASKGASLIKKMMSMTSVEMGSPKVFQVVDLIEESREIYDSVIGSDVSFVVENDLPKGIKIFGDYAQIQQAVMNLILNAKEAVHEVSDPSIKLDIATKQLHSGEIDLELPPGLYVIIRVIDNGAGMNEEQRERCFEPFYTTKNIDSATGVGFAGTGLGLSNTYSIVTEHFGTLTLTSRRSHGTIMSIYLPVHHSALEKENTDIDLSSKQKISVVIGNTSDIHPSVFTTLSNLEFDLLQLRNNQQLVQYYEKKSFNPELLIIDVDQSDSDIVDFFKDLKQRYPYINIIAYTFDTKRWSSLLRFFDGIEVIGKPLGVLVLHSVLKKILSKKENLTLIDKIMIERTNKNPTNLSQPIKKVRGMLGLKKHEKKE